MNTTNLLLYYDIDTIIVRAKGAYIKRDRLEILLGILEIAKTPVKRTHILYKANINFYQLDKYINLLLDLNMLEKIDEPLIGYRTTPKGRQVLVLFAHGEFEIANHARRIHS